MLQFVEFTNISLTYSELGLFARGHLFHLRQATRVSQTAGDHFVKGVQTFFHSILRSVSTGGTFPIELSGTVTLLNWTIKDFPWRKNKWFPVINSGLSATQSTRQKFCLLTRYNVILLMKIKQNVCHHNYMYLILEISVFNSVQLCLGGFTV